jgi:hypothetical protein
MITNLFYPRRQGDVWYGTEGLDVFDKANVTLDVSDGDDASNIDISFCLTISFDGVVLFAQLCGNKLKIDNKHHTKTHKMNDDSAIITANKKHRYGLRYDLILDLISEKLDFISVSISD